MPQRETALAELAALEALERLEPFQSFVARVSPRYAVVPPHLQVLYDLVEETRRRPVRVAVSMPPRSGKSTTLQHAIAWRTLLEPACLNLYASYGQDLAEQASSVIRRLALAGGVSLDRGKVLDWTTGHGGGLKATSVGGGITGRGINDGLALVDDSLKGREEAESKRERDRVWNWFRDDIMSRLEGIASVFVVQCIAEGEMVPMADGTWQAIETIQPGDELIGFDSQASKTVPRKVIAQRLSGEDDIFEIRTDHYTLRANARHPVLVVPENGSARRRLTYEWRKVSDLKSGDIVVGIKSFDSGSRGVLRDLGVPDDDDFGWLFGFLLGDGWVTRHERKRQNGAVSWAVCCALSDPRRTYPRPFPTKFQRRTANEPLSGSEVNDLVSSLMAHFFGSKPYATGFGYVRCDDNAAGRFLNSLGLAAGKGAKNKKIPDWVFRAPLSFRRAVLRGILDADGGKPKKGRAFRLGSTSVELVETSRRLSLISGARATNGRKEIQTAHPPNSKRSVSSAVFSSDILVDGIDTEPEGVGKVKDWNGTDVRLVSVRSVTPCGRANVYDLTVEGVENFFPGGLCAHNTRWHEDDLIGRLQKDGLGDAWRFINLPAIHVNYEPADEKERPDAEPLWLEADAHNPTREGALAWYAKARARGEYSWWSLYQGVPRPREAKVFGSPAYHSDTNIEGRVFIACDPAASASTKADYSVAVALCVTGSGDDMRGRILDVLRGQWEIPELAKRLYAFQQKWYGSPIAVESVGGFKAVAQMIRSIDSRLRVTEITPRGDKFQRAQAVAGAWNAGRVTLPLGAGWVPAFVDELEAFSGVGDLHDDQVDALSHAWNVAYEAMLRLARPPMGSVADPTRWR